MALVLADRVRDTTTTTGTGTVTLSGTAPTGYQNFSVVGNGNTTYYTINAGSQWEVGLGTYSSTGPTLARTTVLSSSNGGSLVDFSTGTKDVFVTYPAEEAVYQDGSAIKAGTAILGVTNGGTGTNTTFTAGSVVFAGASGVYTQDNANLFWDNTNDRLGIGTTSPGSPLDVQTNSSALGISLRGRSSDNVSSLAVRSNDGATIYGQVQGRSTDFRLEASSSNVMTMYTNSNERMRIDSSGNVGIGTSSPSSKLDVVAQDAIRATGFQPFLTLRDSSDSNKGSRIQTASAITIFYNDTTGGGTYTERMRINSSGFVGIGTSSPQVGVHVSFADQSTNRIRLQNTGSGGGNFDIIGGLAGASNAGLSFFDVTNSATRMYITSAGLVGIGTSAPNHTLDVTGNVGLSGNIYMGQGFNNGNSIEVGYGRTGSNFAYIDLIGDTTYSDYGFRMLRGNNGANANSQLSHRGTGAFVLIAEEAAPIAFQTSSTERARISTDGYLLVGTTAPLGGNTSNEYKTTTAGSWPLTLNANDRGLLIRQSAASSGIYAYFEYNGGTNNGQISWSGGTTSYTTTSDARVKKNIVDAPDAGALIDAIKVRSWDFKVDDMHWRYGMVAQELLEVAPEAVTVPEDEEKMMGIDYAKLVPMLIKEVQSLRARVAQLEGN